jgi:hypothetical protein
MSNLIDAKDDWLQEENPDLYHLLKALDGDQASFLWLANQTAGMYRFARALSGDRKAIAALKDLDGQELDYLHGEIFNCGQLQWLAERAPHLHLLFEAVKGDEVALRRLKRAKAGYARIAQLLRDLTGMAQAEGAGETDGEEGLTEDASADVGCLVGEHHLSQHEYGKAIEAFTRAIETHPTADAYEGRAQAYRALARQDDRKVRELRGQS